MAVETGSVVCVDKPILKREYRIGIKGKKLPLTQFCHIVNYVSVLGPADSGIHKNLVYKFNLLTSFLPNSLNNFVECV